MHRRRVTIRPFDETRTLAVHVVPGAAAGPINVVDTLLRAHDGRPASEPRFAELHAWARDRVRLVTTPVEADLVLYPASYAADVAHARRAADAAHAAGRTCLFFDAGDTWTPFPLPVGILYRTSCDRPAMRDNERAMPAFVGDVLAEAAGFAEIDRASLAPARHDAEPRVGFCGYLGTPVGRLAALATGQVQKHRGLALRHRVVRTLAAAPGVRFDAITRATFGGGAHADASRRAERVAFLKNLLDNAYTLCLRGKGNFSFRFYEVLSAARVPLFVDTRCVLPFEDELDWPRLLAWCDGREVSAIGDRVRAFHATFDGGAFVAHQHRLREAWQSHLSPLGFVRQLARRHAV
jgi:hypothetical protein